MLVSRDQVCGTIGGGHLELRAIQQARAWLDTTAGAAADAADAADFVHEQTYALGPSLGQCCGGSVTLRFTRLTPATLRGWPAPQARFVLHLHGAGHVGRAVAKVLEGIDCEVHWIDERDDAFPETAPAAAAAAPHIRRIHTDDAVAEVAQAADKSFFLVLTHSHALDLRITEAVLRRADQAWLGLIGSASKRASFLRRLQQRGLTAQALAGLTCPVGWPGITGKEPGVIAVAIAAQLLALSG
jgi:xanthine dehydrogenase accessory factor